MKTSFKFSPETTIIGDNAFSECHLSGTFTISKNITTTSPAFINSIIADKICLEKGSKMTTITNWNWAGRATYIFITKGVKTISESGIALAYSLTTVEFEEGSELISIGSRAFA